MIEPAEKIGGPSIFGVDKAGESACPPRKETAGKRRTSIEQEMPSFEGQILRCAQDDRGEVELVVRGMVCGAHGTIKGHLVTCAASKEVVRKIAAYILDWASRDEVEDKLCGSDEI